MATNQNNTGISIVICCYNSSQRLGPTLDHISGQELGDNIPIEVLVVNNNSTDGTANYAVAYWGKTNRPFPLRVVEESKTGLSHARGKGIRESMYEVIIFCDDDNWLSPTYLQVAFDIFCKHENIGICGGWNEAISTIPIPTWFINDGALFAVGRPFSTTKKLNPKEFVWGAGMVGRRSILKKIFDERFPFLCGDRKGNLLTGGGDAEICYRCHLLGKEVWFLEDLYLQHFTPANRVSEAYRQAIWEALPINAFYIQKYSRLFEVQAMNKFNRFRSLAKNFLKYCYGYLTSSTHIKNWCGDYLYFLYGWRIFANEERQAIFKFYNLYGCQQQCISKKLENT